MLKNKILKLKYVSDLYVYLNSFSDMKPVDLYQDPLVFEIVNYWTQCGDSNQALNIIYHLFSRNK